MKKNYQIVACLAFAFGFFVHSSQAQTNFYFDANGATAGIGGSGEWKTNSTIWTTNSAGTTAPISGNWISGCPNNAILQGTNGTITNSTSNYLNQLQVNTSDFTLYWNTTGTNRYTYATNSIAGVILADGITLNLSAPIAAYNGGAAGISGNITNASGSTGYSTIAITGNSGSTSGQGVRFLSRFLSNGSTSVNVGTNNWYVRVNVKTTNTGGTIIGTADANSGLNLRGTVTVDNGSLLILSPGGQTSRSIVVYSNIITSAPNAIQIGDPIISPATTSSNSGQVTLRASNTITGELPVMSGSLWYAGSINACGDAKVVLKTGASFGQGGT
ncbi:MAG: hypothetical protein EBY22_17285, partial [Gammaproteobacteria bacterium]|nr:hypothetical protein [Gammaproteobacteria bacterium]